MDIDEGEDDCIVCYSEPKASLGCPCTELTLGAECIQMQVVAGKPAPGKMILHNPARCGICKNWITLVPSDDPDGVVTSQVQKVRSLYDTIGTNLAQAKEETLVDGVVPPQYCERHITFLCHDCGGWYYVGRYDCKHNYKAEPTANRLCAGCRFKKTDASFTPCARHGSGFLAFKCFYCCRVAGWFSEGKHWCDTCYLLQNHVRLHTGKESDQCTQDPPFHGCIGTSTVPVVACRSQNADLKPADIDYCSGGHGPNGSDFYYGCLVCQHEFKWILKDY